MEVRCVGLACTARIVRIEQLTVELETILEQREYAVIASN